MFPPLGYDKAHWVIIRCFTCICQSPILCTYLHMTIYLCIHVNTDTDNVSATSPGGFTGVLYSSILSMYHLGCSLYFVLTCSRSPIRSRCSGKGHSGFFCCRAGIQVCKSSYKLASLNTSKYGIQSCKSSLLIKDSIVHIIYP